MKRERINFYSQMRHFYELVWHSDHDFNPRHISLYFFLVNQNNRNSWAEWFKVPFDIGMMGSRIGSKKTYYSTLNDLVEWGLVIYVKGINDWKSPTMSLIPLSKGDEVPECKGVEVLNRTSTYPSSVPQLEPQPTPQPIPQPIPQPLPLLHPYKDLYTNTRPLDNTVILDDSKKLPATKPRFTPPTLEQVREYISEIQSQIDPEHFCDYYTSKGWKIGNAPMKDWKATVRNWGRKQVASPHGAPQRRMNPMESMEAWNKQRTLELEQELGICETDWQH